MEQKNFTHVRVLFGYHRIDQQPLINFMNDIYKRIWNPLHNFFIPSFKLEEKIRDGAKVKKKFVAPKTPYQRLLETSGLSPAQKDALVTFKKSLNPFTLRLELEEKLETFNQEVAQLTKTAA